MTIRIGDTVRTKGQSTEGTVEAVWVAEYSFQRQPPGTMFACARFRGTWPRFGGGKGDSVVTKRADRFIVVTPEAPHLSLIPRQSDLFGLLP